MAMLTFTDISKEYGGEPVFSHLSGSIDENIAIGIVGPNGIGKTTLLRLISGMQDASEGRISKGKRVRIGYLQQEAIEAFANKTNTVYEEMRGVFSELQRQQEELRRVEHEMSSATDVDDLLEEYGRRLQSFETAGGYEYEQTIEKTLGGLGFATSDFSLPLSHCSGGQKTRALLCRLLLEEPDVLIMDEPTNHLDADAVEWLEGTLLRWEKALVIVSHDRYFLDTTVKQIWEMNSYGIERYSGNYSAYTVQRAERRARREKTFNATMEFFLSELHYIRRFIDKKTEQAKGRMKRLVRHVKAVEIGGPEALEKQWNVFLEESGGISGAAWSVNELERHIRELRCRNPYTKPMSMRIQTRRHLSDRVLTVKHASIGYPHNTLFSIDEAEIRRGYRVALLGPNGSGKSTFLRTILGDIPALAGSTSLGENVQVGYFAQSHDILDPDRTVVDELMSHAAGMLEAEARQYLGAYLFSNDDVYKLTRALSGGERGRLVLAILALKRMDFLVLDEPTNHLDMQSREILEDGLLNFEGTILIVTHDRYLVDKIATHIWDIKDGSIEPFVGTYRKYRESLLEEASSNVVTTAASRPPSKTKNRTKKRTTKVDSALSAESIERQIESLEAELADLSNRLETAVETQNAHRIKTWKDRYYQTKLEIQALLDQWDK